MEFTGAGFCNCRVMICVATTTGTPIHASTCPMAPPNERWLLQRIEAGEASTRAAIGRAEEAEAMLSRASAMLEEAAGICEAGDDCFPRTRQVLAQRIRTLAAELV